MKFPILIITTICLGFSSCSNPKPPQPKIYRAIPVPQRALPAAPPTPTTQQLSKTIEELKTENSELRMKLLENILTD